MTFPSIYCWSFKWLPKKKVAPLSTPYPPSFTLSLFLPCPSEDFFSKYSSAFLFLILNGLAMLSIYLGISLATYITFVALLKLNLFASETLLLALLSIITKWSTLTRFITGSTEDALQKRKLLTAFFTPHLPPTSFRNFYPSNSALKTTNQSFNPILFLPPNPPPTFFFFSNYPMTTGFIQPSSMDIFF